MDQQRVLLNKTLIIGIILLFLCICINSSYAFDIVKKSSTSFSNGNILYVGGSGPDNYTRIQNAIDNATDGDTVFVYNGWYNESLFINKSISVNGQDRDKTFIGLGNNPYTFVRIDNAKNVEFRRFTIEQHKVSLDQGFYISECSNCQIAENCIRNREEGIRILRSKSINVSNNIIQYCTFGIEMSHTKATIEENIIDGNEKGYGIGVYITENINIIRRNTIKNNLYGINLYNALFTIITKNNFLQNTGTSAVTHNSFLSVWVHNYWNRPRILPKIIFGIPPGIDVRPSLLPFDIGG